MENIKGNLAQAGTEILSTTQVQNTRALGLLTASLMIVLNMGTLILAPLYLMNRPQVRQKLLRRMEKKDISL